MSYTIIKKIIPFLLILTLLTFPTTATTITPHVVTTLKNQIEITTQQPTITQAEQDVILQELNNNSSRYFTISAGIRATSFFLKIPRRNKIPLTPRLHHSN